ncbi:MAG: DUF58 domain-containing protein [Clostridia bacterium]|nr:DUF58 domain-containing protein [Clostridia bacterium]
MPIPVTAMNWPDPALLARLENYRLVHRRPVFGQASGRWRSRLKGGGVEFADYREYTPGDEPRRIDWKAYARLRRLYVREFLDDRRDTSLLVLDLSASMDWGEVAHKGRYALGLALGLGVCAQAGHGSVAAVITPPSGSRAGAFFPPAGGRQGLARLRRFLEQCRPGGRADPAGALEAVGPTRARIHSLYLISDLWDLSGLEDFLRRAAAWAREVTVLHVLAPGEREPQGEGEWTLVDAETGEKMQVSLTPAALAAYRQRLTEHLGEVRACCGRWGARYVELDSGTSLEDTMLSVLPRAGVIRPGT